jgi:hypothetical protein
MNRNKLFEIVLIYLAMAILFSACAAVPPPTYGVAPLQDGNVLHLFKGFAQWLVIDGDALVKTFYNQATDITVHTRPLLDGFAIACQKSESCDDIVAYFVNIRTYNDFKAWLIGAGGFTEIVRNLPTLPVIPMRTILTMFVVTPAGYQEGDTLHAWDVMPCMGPMCAEDELGNTYYPASWGLDTESDADGFAEESETWEVEIIEQP